MIHEFKAKWARIFEELTPKSQKRILKTKPKEREVRSLGRGRERVADLVVHPKHGLTVRKISYALSHRFAGRKAADERRIAKALPKAKRISHIIAEEGHKGRGGRRGLDRSRQLAYRRRYYQYVKGKRRGWSSTEKILEGRDRGIIKAQRKMQKVMKKAHGPRARVVDIGGPNLVKGKIVDYHVNRRPSEYADGMYPWDAAWKRRYGNVSEGQGVNIAKRRAYR